MGAFEIRYCLEEGNLMIGFELQFGGGMWIMI